MPFMNRLNSRAVTILGACKVCDDTGLLLHKRKNGADQ